jgi:hypothetical protein
VPPGEFEARKVRAWHIPMYLTRRLSGAVWWTVPLVPTHVPIIRLARRSARISWPVDPRKRGKEYRLKLMQERSVLGGLAVHAWLIFSATTSAAFASPLYSVGVINPPNGFRNPVMSGINDSGQVAGGGTNGTGREQAFIGTTSGSTAIPLPPG